MPRRAAVGQELLEVDLVGVALEDLAAGGVAENIDVRVFAGAQDAGGDLLGGLVEAGVDAGDDDVELGEGVVFEVHLAVEEDVAFDAGEEAEGDRGFAGEGVSGGELALVAIPLRAAAAFELLVELGGDLADFGGVEQGAAVVHAAGHGEELGVVGDRDVFEAAEDGGFGHGADGVGAVGLEGVHVDVAAEVGADDQVRERVGGGGFDFSGIFAEFGRDVVEVEGIVDFGLGGGGDHGVVFDAEQSIFA